MDSHRARILDQFSQQAVPFSTAAPIRDEDALERIVAASGAGPDDLVLDVACGPGLVACAFARRARHVTGIDVTPAMIERARVVASEKQLTNLSWHCGDVLPLPFEDGAFSVVVSRFAFHHFEEPGRVLCEMRRVCRPGGRVVVVDLLASQDPRKAEAWHQIELLRDPSHARALPLVELRALFDGAALPAASETFYGMDVELEALLKRSFPAAGSEPEIRRGFSEASVDDGYDLKVRHQGSELWFTYPVAILSAQRP